MFMSAFLTSACLKIGVPQNGWVFLVARLTKSTADPSASCHVEVPLTGKRLGGSEISGNAFVVGQGTSGTYLA